MADRLCLTLEEIEELTDRVRPSAQRRALNALGIPFRTRPDNSIVVLRSAIEPAASARTPKRREPDMDALRRVS